MALYYENEERSKAVILMGCVIHNEDWYYGKFSSPELCSCNPRRWHVKDVSGEFLTWTEYACHHGFPTCVDPKDCVRPNKITDNSPCIWTKRI